jgi:F0F1-type ATP synthase assembly protein I
MLIQFALPGFIYGLLQVRVGLATLFLHYEFSPCAKTKACSELNPWTLIISLVNGMCLRIHRRM